jgi:hypothetical protein
MLFIVYNIMRNFMPHAIVCAVKTVFPKWRSVVLYSRIIIHGTLL